MDFEPAPSRGGWVGLALLTTVLASQVALAAAMARVGFGPLAALLFVAGVLLVPLAARLAFWLWGWRTMDYHLGRDGVIIRWGPTRQVVPMAEITHVLNGRPYGGRLRGLHWPGHIVGHTVIATEDGATHDTLVFATRPPAEQVLIVTAGLAYAISPADRAAFVEEFRIRNRLGPVQTLTHSTDQPDWVRRSIWHDSLAVRLAIAGLVLNVIAFAWLIWRIPALAPMVPLQLTFDAVAHAAVPGPLRPRTAVWLLPLIGLAGMVLNGGLAFVVHQRDRVAALLLLSGAVSLQLALGVIVWRLF
jgi:hypothetical protein